MTDGKDVWFGVDGSPAKIIRVSAGIPIGFSGLGEVAFEVPIAQLTAVRR